MIECEFRPIHKWPGKRSHEHRPSRFKAGWTATLNLLESELQKLKATHIVIEIDVTEGEIRRDGWPRVDARPTTAGVIVSFNSKHGALRYPCDTFTGWKNNVRAIALGLQALRAVDRYGVTAHAEQYTGWKVLTDGSQNGSFTTVEEAAAFLVEFNGGAFGVVTILGNPSCYRATLRNAQKATHPDTGGSDGAFQRVQQAAAMLDEHFAESGQ